MRTKTQLKLRITDSDVGKIIDAAGGDTPSSIKVKISATHSGLVNKNYWFYSPSGMADGAKTFIKPYPKPVTLNHDPASDPIGRVIDAKYISYNMNNYLDITDSKDKNYLKNVNTFVNSKTYKQVGYKGLGEIELIAEITDAEAIKKLLDKRYLTVSVGGGSDAAYCSICGANKMAKDCGHYRGETYDNQSCFLISGKLTYRHVSYVSEPADENALSEVLDHNENTTIEILDFTLGNKSIKMKLTLEQLKDKYGTYPQFVDFMKTLNITDSLTTDVIATASAAKFVFADEKILPIVDKAHLLASHALISDSLEDSDIKKEILTSLEDKLKEALGDVTIADALSAYAKVEDTAPATLKPFEFTDSDLTTIAEKVAECLKKTVTVDDSYTGQRLKALEKDNATLEDALGKLELKYKDNVVLQIISLEDKLSDTDYKALLVGRTLVSLEDKLSDLVIAKTNAPKEIKTEEQKVLDSASVTDAQSTDVEQVEDNTNTAETAQAVELTVKEVNDEYKNILRTKGFKDARIYLQALKTENKLPKHFTVN